MNIIELESRFTSGVYPKRRLAIVRGQGAHLWDEQGREYIDCAAGIGVANVGHCHPRVVAALTQQAQTLITCPEIFYNNQRAELERRLIELAPQGLDRVFLCNSGTEAMETALKLARLATKRPNFVACMRGFHGRTMGALSATYKKEYREPFMPLLDGFSHVPFENLEALEQAVDERTAGVFIEVVQGEGGVRPASSQYLRGVEQLCRQRGTMLIVDEVQTGFGRTGKLFAVEHSGITPDFLCVAKALGGGVPIGAALFNSQKTGEIPKGVHGSTFGGNPLAAAAACAALDVIIGEDLSRRAQELGEYFMNQLRAIQSPLIREVRGLGLMVGIELKEKVQPYLEALMEKGVLALPAGPNVLRLLPPLVISKEDLDTVVRRLGEVLTD
ncbi:MAG: aspartate aminotransferase family protein [Deinococcus sp.]|nr:aspartate aminotransferase family protein [Deinococcus sp.]